MLAMFKFALSTLLLAHSAAAQYGYGPPAGDSSSSPSSTGAAAASAPSAPPSTDGHINVDVFPNGQFTFNPDKIVAPVGTNVTFFFPAQIPQSVTQSSFSNPCTPLAANGSNPGGFDSGLQTSKTFTLTITDSKPIWFFCKQVLHCGMGMVGSINAATNGTNTHDAFVSAAKALGGNAPQVSDSGTPVLTGVGAVATAAPADSSSSSSSQGSSGSSGSAGNAGVKTAAHAGLYLGAAGIAALLL